MQSSWESRNMVRRRGACGFGMAFALVFSVGLFGQQLDKKIDEALKKEAQALSKLADAPLAAQAGPNDFNVSWVDEDFLKGPQGKEFVPFTVTLDPTKVPGGNLVLYWRVVPTAPPPDPAKKNDNRRTDP